MKTVQTVTVRAIERIKSSVNGNGRFSLIVTNSEGATFTLKTAPDSSCSNSVDNARRLLTSTNHDFQAVIVTDGRGNIVRFEVAQ